MKTFFQNRIVKTAFILLAWLVAVNIAFNLLSLKSDILNFGGIVIFIGSTYLFLVKVSNIYK
jgi:hypothetical protein